MTYNFVKMLDKSNFYVNIHSMLDIETREDIDFYNDEVKEDEVIGVNIDDVKDGNLLTNLKPKHKSDKKGMYFDEEYFADLVLNKYLPSVKKDDEGNIISRDAEAEKEVLANILLIVNAVINKYGIWRFEKWDILQNEGVSECWRALETFDPSRKKKFFHYLSLVAKFHLVNLTKKDKESRKAADVDICPELEGKQYNEDDLFIEELENAIFDIIDKDFDSSIHDKYIDLASILMDYIKKNRMIVGKNDLYSTFREYGYKTNDFKKFIADLEPYKEELYSLC